MKHLYSLPALLLLVVMLFISGCKDDCTECCDDDLALISISPISGGYLYEQYTGSTASGEEVTYYSYLGGTPQRVQFFRVKQKDNICTGEHLNIAFTVRTTTISQTKPLKILGEMYWSLWGDDIILFDGAVEPNHTYTGSIHDLGLKQAFPEGAAAVTMYIIVEFESLGSIDLDIAYFEEHIWLLEASYDYKKF